MFAESEIESALERNLGRKATEEELARALPGIRDHLNWLQQKQPEIWARYSHEQRLDMAARVASQTIRSNAREATRPIRRFFGAVWAVFIVAVALGGMGYLIFSIPYGWVGGSLALFIGGTVGWYRARPDKPWQSLRFMDRVGAAVLGAGVVMWELLMLMGLQLSAERWG